MNTQPLRKYTSFAGARRIASGDAPWVALTTKAALDNGENERVLIFDDLTGEQIELDFRGTPADVRARMTTTPSTVPADRESNIPRGPGRPKLGVVAREVTLLPRHWDWLSRQPGGASVALRKLVEEARRVYKDRDRVREAQEAAYRFLSAIAGNLPGFEEALRALFAGNRERFDHSMNAWPADVREYAQRLAAEAFPQR